MRLIFHHPAHTFRKTLSLLSAQHGAEQTAQRFAVAAFGGLLDGVRVDKLGELRPILGLRKLLYLLGLAAALKLPAKLFNILQCISPLFVLLYSQ